MRHFWVPFSTESVRKLGEPFSLLIFYSLCIIYLSWPLEKAPSSDAACYGLLCRNLISLYVVCTSLYLKRVSGSEVDWDECQPDDAGGVHGEADELGLVEVLRDLSGLDGVVGADANQQHVVDLRHQETGVVDVAFQNHLELINKNTNLTECMCSSKLLVSGIPRLSEEKLSLMPGMPR